MITDPTIRYRPETDTLAIELRAWPGDVTGDASQIGGEDAGSDLVIHYAADGKPWLWDIERASAHPEHIAAALGQVRRLTADAA
jgi:hypothetical protein